MIRSRMTHRCLIERNSLPGLDGYGNARPPTWATLLSAQPCYYYQPSVRSAEQQGERNVKVYAQQLLLPLGVDVTEADRINGVVDRLGRSVAAGPFNIVAIVRKPDHLLLSLESAT
jgi:hypothetical protein